MLRVAKRFVFGVREDFFRRGLADTGASIGLDRFDDGKDVLLSLFHDSVSPGLRFLCLSLSMQYSRKRKGWPMVVGPPKVRGTGS